MERPRCTGSQRDGGRPATAVHRERSITSTIKECAVRRRGTLALVVVRSGSIPCLYKDSYNSKYCVVVYLSTPT